MFKGFDSSKVLGALAFGVLVAGCATGDGETDPAVEQSTAQLVGVVELSPTHSVKFWDHGDGLGEIRESFDADRDRSAALSMNKIDLNGRPLAEVYEIFAAAKTDPTVKAKLSAMDRLHAANLLASPPPGALETPSDIGPLLGTEAGSSPMPTERPGTALTPNAPEGIEARQGAATCTEPAWNWEGDTTWFVTNFCTSQNGVLNWSCRTQQTNWISWGWYGWLSFFQATAFNQSHCANAQWILKWRVHSTGGSLEKTPVNMAVAPRRVEISAWNATGKTEFYSKITPTNVGVQRVGLAIHQVVR